jgi:CspA family cold shock protein
MSTKIGTVKWFNNKKGFGFIVPTDGSADVFVHISDVEEAGLQTLQENQKLEFEVASDRGKVKAVNLKKAA